MSKTPALDLILPRLKRELTQLYGPRLQQVLLYGSRARGDYREDSDYDILVVLEPPFHWWNEIKQLADISTRIGIETAGEAILSLRPVTATQMQERTGFMHNVRREMIAL